MKILITSTPLLDSPPSHYGGLERVCYDVACGLGELGHKVVMAATDDSTIPTNGHLHKIGKAKGTVNTDWVKAEQEMWVQLEPYLGEFDIIHSNDWFGFNYLYKAENPELNTCHTHHGGMNPEWWNKTKAPFHLNLIAISNWMRTVYQSQGFESQVAYNPVSLDDYPYHAEKGERYMFLGRIDNIKAPHLAIEACRKAGVGLDVVGGTSFVSDLNYVEQIKKLCDGEQTRFIGEVDHGTKVDYLQHARGLVVTPVFKEPFGLYLVEALSCGTPVIGFKDGATPEIIINDFHGKLVENYDVDSLASVLSSDIEFNTKNCRLRAEHFSRKRCAERYEQLYQNILDGYTW